MMSHEFFFHCIKDHHKLIYTHIFGNRSLFLNSALSYNRGYEILNRITGIRPDMLPIVQYYDGTSCADYQPLYNAIKEHYEELTIAIKLEML